MPYRGLFHRARGLALLVAALTWATNATPLVGQSDVTDEDVEIAIRQGIDHIWAQQAPDGAWTNSAYSNKYPIGLTALATFALRTAGISTDDPRMDRAIKHLTKSQKVNTTYERSLRAMVYSTLNPKQYRTQRNADARWLIARQHLSGAWGYAHDPSQSRSRSAWTDNSNSQFAILGLWQAAMVGSEVPRTTWQKAARHWLSSQNEDGGWGYRPSMRIESYGSMTAAGVATCFVLYDQLYSRASGRFDGQIAAKCGTPSRAAVPVIRAIDGGLDWLGRRFAAGENPGLGNVSHLTYYHYSIERAGIASGRKLFGAHDWYHELGAHLVAAQHRDGSWGDLQETCFALLALVKGRAPILISKLQHDGDWNNDPRDVARFTSWLGRRFERNVAWQIIDLDSSSDLHDAPVLYFNGHDAPKFSPEHAQRLKEFVSKGGTIFAQTCCHSTRFVDQTTAFFNETFPELQVAPLDPDHPVWTMHFPLKPTAALTAWSDGCRARIFLVKNNLCCAWHRGMTSTYRDRFELGANLVFYATNLAPLTQKRRQFLQPPASPPVNTLLIARIKHGGDWATDPNALSNLSIELAQSCGWAIEEKPAVDLATDPLDEFPVLWLVGHERLDLSPDDADALSRYLRNGGFLIANAACGRSSFDESFRAWITQVIPAENWRTLSSDHPILLGPAGTSASRLMNLRYKRDTTMAARQSSTLPARMGYIDDSPVVFYADLDFVCGMDGHPCPRCSGLLATDARALGVNLLIHVLGQRDTVEGATAATSRRSTLDPDLTKVIEGRSK